MYDVAVVGTGANPDDPGRDGYAMAYRHADGYVSHEDCRLVACADLVRENAIQFADTCDVPRVFGSAGDLLAECSPDIVSVCVPPAAHEPVVTELAASGQVTAIHCEKPMATTWADCRSMVEACRNNDVRLSFNHQMRFGEPFARAKTLLDEGAIGALRRVEFTEDDLFDSGTHLFDLCNYYLDYAPVEWVLANIDYRDENVWFGAHNENQALAQWRYASGVTGIASTGRGADSFDPFLRLSGTDGTVEIRQDADPLWLRQDGSGWRSVNTGVDHVYGPRHDLLRAGLGRALDALPVGSGDWVRRPRYTTRAIHEIVEALRAGERSELADCRALASTELIFASWESARSRRRIELPLEIDDNPLESMVEAGELAVEPTAD